jgi:hypothetical protein
MIFGPKDDGTYRKHQGPSDVNYRTHFAHRIDMWDNDGENVNLLATDGDRPVHRRRRGADPWGGVITYAGAASAVLHGKKYPSRHLLKCRPSVARATTGHRPPGGEGGKFSAMYRRMLENIVRYLDDMEVPKPLIDSMVATGSAEIRWVDSLDNRRLQRPPSFAEWIDASCGSFTDQEYNSMFDLLMKERFNSGLSQQEASAIN